MQCAYRMVHPPDPALIEYDWPGGTSIQSPGLRVCPPYFSEPVIMTLNTHTRCTCSGTAAPRFIRLVNTRRLSSGSATGSCHCSTPAGMPVLFNAFLAAVMPGSRDVVTRFARRIPPLRRTSLTFRAPLSSPFAFRSSSESSGRH